MAVDLCIFACVTEHDKWRRRELAEKFRALGTEPKEQGDRLEIRQSGSREIILRLAAICESCKIHDIHVNRAES